MDVPGAGAGVTVAVLEHRLALQGIGRGRGEEVGRGRRNGGSAAESEVGVIEGQQVSRRRRGPRRAQETGEADTLAELMPWVLAAILKSLALVLEFIR